MKREYLYKNIVLIPRTNGYQIAIHKNRFESFIVGNASTKKEGYILGKCAVNTLNECKEFLYMHQLVNDIFWNVNRCNPLANYYEIKRESEKKYTLLCDGLPVISNVDSNAIINKLECIKGV